MSFAVSCAAVIAAVFSSTLGGREAAHFARIVMYLTDRTYKDEVFANQVEEFIKTKAEKGNIPDEITRQIEIR